MKRRITKLEAKIERAWDRTTMQNHTILDLQQRMSDVEDLLMKPRKR